MGSCVVNPGELDGALIDLRDAGGIFASPGVVLRETGSVGSALLIWGIAGALNWAGASSFAELGTSIPLNGGAQACQSILVRFR